MGITIRSPTQNDINPLVKFHKKMIGDFENPTQEDNFKSYVYVNSKLIKIALKDADIVGYILSSQQYANKIQIYTIYVNPSFQGKLIGTKLIKSLEAEFIDKSLKVKFLSARIPRKLFYSAPFFQKLGFKLISKINIYQKDDLSFPFTVNPLLIIRPITKYENDLQQVARLEAVCFSKYWQMEKSDFYQKIKDEMSILFLAFINEKLVGYNYNSHSKNTHEGQYIRVATHPEFRNQGIATSLSVNAFKWFKKNHVRIVRLTTFAESKLHNRIYTNWGFRKVGQEMILAKEYS